MPHALVQIAAAVLALTFGWAAVAKILNARAWSYALKSFDLSEPVRRAALLLIPVVELGLCTLLLAGSTRPGAALATATLAIFSLALLRARDIQRTATGRGDRLPCACFGKATDRDYRLLLARNALLAALAAFLLVSGTDVSPFEDLGAPRAADAIPVVLLISGSSLLVLLARELTTSLRRGQR